MAVQQQSAQSDATNLLQALDMVAKEKGIDRARLVKTIEEAILKAAQSVFGPNRELQATFNEETGQVDLFQFIGSEFNQALFSLAHGETFVRGRLQRANNAGGFQRMPYITSIYS